MTSVSFLGRVCCVGGKATPLPLLVLPNVECADQGNLAFCWEVTWVTVFCWEVTWVTGSLLSWSCLVLALQYLSSLALSKVLSLMQEKEANENRELWLEVAQ